MNFALLILLLALVWTAVTGSLTSGNLLLGVGVALLSLWLVRNRIEAPRLLGRGWRIAALAWLFVYELVLSAVRVALMVLRPDLKSYLKPAIIAFPLSVTRDIEITLLANLITLTPGTLSVDVSNDRKHLYIHAISVPDKAALIRDIAGGFEKRILEVFQ